MAMNTMTLLLSVLAISVVSNAGSPAPAVDCSTVVVSMADCLTYVTGASSVTKPEGNCCSGLKTVLKSNPQCLCETFKNSAQFGITLNVTKALSLPAACHVSAPSVSNCGLSLVAGAVPAATPASAVSPIPGGPTSSAGGNDLAPAPAPMMASSATPTFSVGSFLAALLAASFSFI
ncbi:bifunctional inhibitor/lipid-transfer protein/seed storage 2S albumin superfamily protein [Actinidia rufa]|uniref:Bifunctional inhibitor/lipid-transfer protein/seed storage 2S albumin superfamily protein n=1 Tax=Actinidia rufa TaxID=165716 RepID=A0A7J0ERN7_9ERIC|nr:bifunctional inhibitor/lipid-transfer protein/seed storage 2S albumin superfamily protein [Actinidia rufa]